jgi:hypothetical protein
LLSPVSLTRDSNTAVRSCVHSLLSENATNGWIH